MTEAQRDLISSPKDGLVIYNTDTDKLNYYNGGSSDWAEVGSGSGGGGLNLFDDPSAESGVTEFTSSGTGITAEQETTASNCPLNPYKETCIKLTNAGSGTGYTRVRKTLPDALKGTINHISWFQEGDGTYASGDYELQIYSNDSSDYSGSYTEIASYEADSSGDFLISDATGKNIAHYLTNESYLEFRFVRVSGSNHLYLNELEIGTGQISTGPALRTITDFAPMITNNGSKSFTNHFVAHAQGEWLTCQFVLNGDSTAAGGSSNHITLTLPSGYTINTDLLASSTVADNSIGRCDTIGLDSTGAFEPNTVLAASSTTLKFMNVPSSTAIMRQADINVSNTVIIRGEFKIPIAEWAGQASAYLGSNDVEYASSSIAWTSVDTDASNTQFGPSGSEITGAQTSWKLKIVGFQTPIQPTDIIKLQVSDDGVVWTEAGVGHLNNKPLINTFSTTGSADNSSGMFAYKHPSIANAVGIKMHRYQNIANDDSPANDWTSGFWRVVKHRSGIATSFGQATATQSGLVKKNKSQVKILAASAQTDGAFITFNNLVVGKRYRVYAQIRLTFTGVTPGAAKANIQHDGNILAVVERNPDSLTATDITTMPMEAEFTATTTTATIVGDSLSTEEYVSGNGNRENTWGSITELNNYDPNETTDFT